MLSERLLTKPRAIFRRCVFFCCFMIYLFRRFRCSATPSMSFSLFALNLISFRSEEEKYPNLSFKRCVIRCRSKRCNNAMKGFDFVRLFSLISTLYRRLLPVFSASVIDRRLESAAAGSGAATHVGNWRSVDGSQVVSPILWHRISKGKNPPPFALGTSIAHIFIEIGYNVVRLACERFRD